jgi:hypothetical protein
MVDRVHAAGSWVHGAFIKPGSFILRWRAAILFGEGVWVHLISAAHYRLDGDERIRSVAAARRRHRVLVSSSVKHAGRYDTPFGTIIA